MTTHDQPHAAAQPLPGGNVSAGVVRIGDTVRRPAGPWTPAVHALDGWTFIDWDTAGPASRLWDVAYAVHGFIPLSADPT
ncbi:MULTISPECIES: hypothetical protein [Streptomyces]|uniref:hypothetical protein n=1 Tax=Streptomyces TaxID=1883 RepID=UPI001F5F0B8F|nr:MULTISPECIES: hypothetical protein [Streptomyces]